MSTKDLEKTTATPEDPACGHGYKHWGECPMCNEAGQACTPSVEKRPSDAVVPSARITSEPKVKKDTPGEAWTCACRGVLNDASRSKCRACSAPRPSDALVEHELHVTNDTRELLTQYCRYCAYNVRTWHTPDGDAVRHYVDQMEIPKAPSCPRRRWSGSFPGDPRPNEARPERVPWCEEHTTGGQFSVCLACACRELETVLSLIDSEVTGEHEVAPYDVDHDARKVLERVRTVVMSSPTRPRSVIDSGMVQLAQAWLAGNCPNAEMVELCERIVRADSRVGYSYAKRGTPVGNYYEFYGPGMPQHANGLHLTPRESIPDYEADRAVQLLALAFFAGRAAKARELREVLGEGAR